MIAKRKLSGITVAACVVVVACGSGTRRGAGDPATSAPSDQPHLPSAFTVSRIVDFREAAAAVGFDIPKSDLYPLHWGYLFIQPSVDLSPSTPRTATAIYDVQQYTVEVTLRPLSFRPAAELRKGY